MKTFHSLVVLLIMIGSDLNANPSHQHSKHGIHGMLLFGDARHLYVSHLPLFAHPHNQQVIAAIQLDGISDEQINTWMQTPGLKTVVPEAFDLQLISKPGFQVKVDLYIGHFERGGTLKTSGLSMTIQHIVVNSPLPNSRQKSQVIYQKIMTAEPTDKHHYYRVIESRPAADHILTINTTEKVPAQMTFATNQLFVAPEDLAKQLNLPITAVNQLYLEINELR